MPILDCCKELPEVRADPGAVLLAEGTTTGKLYVLIEGEVQVLRNEVEIATVADPGAVFGEMAILLGAPHTATVKALTPCRLHVVEDAERFLTGAPEMMRHIGKLLALRLQLATGYLADIKTQFAEHGDHLCLVDEVLESLLHQQEAGFTPGGSARDGGPNF
jgi:CRP/FNR family transcriptional regulator, cyclic AMP receptor protein